MPDWLLLRAAAWGSGVEDDSAVGTACAGGLDAAVSCKSFLLTLIDASLALMLSCTHACPVRIGYRMVTYTEQLVLLEMAVCHRQLEK